jgi:Domain of unknown function (DU1801)
VTPPEDPQDIASFLDRVTPDDRQGEARRLVAIFSTVTGFPARLWPGGIVGFGRYAYVYDSGHRGESLATGFSPRKAEISLYGLGQDPELLAGLGKHRQGKACVYLRRLETASEEALRALIRAGLADLARRWPILPE